jgi:hypothetical protein
MNRRVVVILTVGALAAIGFWLTRSSRAPAATWRLGDGDTMRQARNYEEVPPETAVRLSFACDESCHVYVFSHSDEDGTLLLHPSPQVQTDIPQPLPAGRTVLPGRNRDRDLAWNTRMQVLATTTFLVVAAEQPLAELEALFPRLRRWTNTARTDGSMQVTLPASGERDLLGAPRQPWPHALLQRAADRTLAATIVNGPLEPDTVHPGVWTGGVRIKEAPK